MALQSTGHFLFILTVIQFWWIAVWGIAYIVIAYIAGTSKTIELVIYASIIMITAVVLHLNPMLIEML